MAKKLDDYRSKRDPARTNEPFGAEPSRRAGDTRSGRFVVHLHDATREHYDLRVEVGGVLESFAVPRGPSLLVKDKRLAMHTERHPIDYLDFEAVIPEGNYGAGPMILWDRGTIQYLEHSAEEGLQTGKLDFILHGFKLRGRFALVKLGGKKKSADGKREWLLLKKADAHARDDGDITEDAPRSVVSGLRVDELPRASEVAAAVEADARKLGARNGAPSARDLVPMRCAEDGGKLDDAKCLYELKLDGVRIVAERNGDQVSLRYRTLRAATGSYPEIVRALRLLASQRVILDGEIVTFDERGRPSFALLASRIHASNPRDVLAAERARPVVYVVFDVIAIGDLDLRKLPLRDRKAILARVVPGNGVVRVLEHVERRGEQLMAFCETHDLEGVIGKRADSPYTAGPKRSRDWFKIKRARADDFVVVGLARGEGSRRRLGALDIASYEGKELVSRGRVGSGLDDEVIDALLAQLSRLEVKKAPMRGDLMPAPRGQVFFEPRVVVSVEHAGFTPEGRLRHPIFRGLRPDMSPSECTAAPHEALEDAPPPAPTRPAPPARAKRDTVTITNPDKVFWPDEGITKRNVCDYYAGIADTLLPYLRDRPVLMVRYPDGIHGKHFYQWNAPKQLPSFIETRTIESEDDGKEITYLRVEDRDALVYIANLGCIPLHILASRFEDLERCDFVTIDFDLGPAPLRDAITLAQELHALLDEIGMLGFPKTSGQTGLHVLVPVGGIPFEAAKALAALLGRILHQRHPKLSTLQRMRAKRPDVVYIDTGQTGRSRAIVAPYSLRAHPGATVSTPLRWDEVGPSLSPARFDIFTVTARAQEHSDPMSGLLTEQPDLADALERLQELVRR